MTKLITYVLLALALAGLATTAHSSLNVPQALEAQLAATNLTPSDARAHNDLGNLYMLSDRFAEAEAAYDAAIALDPNLVSARFNRALLLERQGKNRAALRELDELLDRQGDHAAALFERGSIYERWGLRDRAIRSYARAFAIDRRLSFPEFNAQVIESRLLTEALLAANREPRQDLQAPPRYEDPARIAALLVDVPSGAQLAAESSTAASANGGGSTQSYSGGASRVVDASGLSGQSATTGRASGGAIGNRGTVVGYGGEVRELEPTTVRSWVAEDSSGDDPSATAKGQAVQTYVGGAGQVNIHDPTSGYRDDSGKPPADNGYYVDADAGTQPPPGVEGGGFVSTPAEVPDYNNFDESTGDPGQDEPPGGFQLVPGSVRPGELSTGRLHLELRRSHRETVGQG